MDDQSIICPNCKTQIPLTKAIEEIKNTMEEKLNTKLKEKEKNLESDLQKRFDDKKKIEIDKAIEEKKEEFKREKMEALYIIEIEKENFKKEVILVNEEKQKLQEQLNEKNEIYRKKLEEYREIGKEAGKSEAIKELTSNYEHEKQKMIEEHKIEKKQQQLTLEKLTKQIEEIAKHSDKITTDVKGETGEIYIKDLICSIYKNDKIEIIPKRKGGADVIHTIIEGNHTCGIILYECKRTDTFGKDWVKKLKEDSIEIKSDFNVIVTKTMPTDNIKPHNVNNVWIVSYYDIEGVIRLLRDSIVRLDLVYNSQSDGTLKREELYKYITSIEYNRKTEIVLGKLTERRKKQEKKKTEFLNYWKKEIEETNSLILDLNEIFCSIEGIRDRCLDKSELIIIENKM